MVSTNKILSTYSISEEYGFLSINSIEKLSTEYAEWENIAEEFTGLFETDKLRVKLDEMRIIHDPFFKNKIEWERAMLLLSYFANAYVMGINERLDYLPESIVIPLVKVADKLKRKPILSHASAVLNNWKLINPDKPFSIQNIGTIINFKNSKIESSYILKAILFEKNAAKGIKTCIDAILAIEKNDELELLFSLQEIKKTILILIQNLKELKSDFESYFFNKEQDPLQISFENIDYKGVENPIRTYRGFNIMQSLIFQMFDALFCIRNNNLFLKEMRDYMSPLHHDFLRFITFKSKLKDYCLQRKSLQNDYKDCLDLLEQFRSEYLNQIPLSKFHNR